MIALRSRPSKFFWLVLTVVTVGFTAFVVVRNLVHVWKIKRSLSQLGEQPRAYLEQIEADSALIEQLRYDDYLEEYARERFRMQRDGERVFLFEE